LRLDWQTYRWTALFSTYYQALDLVTRLVTNKPFGDVEIPVVYETKNTIGAAGDEGGALHGLRHSILPSAVGFVVGIAVTYLFAGRSKRSGYQAV